MNASSKRNTSKKNTEDRKLRDPFRERLKIASRAAKEGAKKKKKTASKEMLGYKIKQ